MKIARRELASLLSPAPVGVGPATPPAPDTPAVANSDLGLALKRVAARLWAKVDVANLTRAEQRQRMLELIIWFADKQGWTHCENVPQRYPANGRTVAGRMHLELSHQNRTLRLEILFEPSGSALEKLRAAHQAGYDVAVLALFGMDFKTSVESLQRQAGASIAWLTVIAP